MTENNRKLMGGSWDLAGLKPEATGAGVCGGEQKRSSVGMAAKLRREGLALGLGRT